MAAIALRRDEGVALVVALAAHAALLALLVARPPAPPLPMPERMTVTLSDEAALTSTAPQPSAATAPDLGEAAPQPEPVPAPRPAPSPAPLPRATMAPPPPKAAPLPRPAPPQPTAAKTPPSRPAPPKVAGPTAPGKTAPAKAMPKPAGASRIGDDFLKGTPGAASKSNAATAPAAAIGPAVKSALAGAISRQLKPKWAAPQGADAELLVTILTWDLNPDGTLSGSPRVVSQQGITDANRAQAARHAEQAIRAVRLAAPFALPPEFYPAWKRVVAFRFDRKLSQ